MQRLSSLCEALGSTPSTKGGEEPRETMATEWLGSSVYLFLPNQSSKQGVQSSVRDLGMEAHSVFPPATLAPQATCSCAME